jgi:hypothetical protein
MASAILKVNNVQGFVSSAKMHETIRRNMSLPRETVPPQLPQIPLELWQALWDDLAFEFADFSIWAKSAMGCAPESNTCMGYAKCIMGGVICCTCCMPCCMIYKVTRLNTRGATLYDGLLERYRPRFAAVGVGMSVNEITVYRQKGGNSQQKAGFRLDGAAGAAAMGAPPPVAGMTRHVPGWEVQGGQGGQMQQGVQMQGMPTATPINVPMAVPTLVVAEMKPQMASTNGGGGAAEGADIATQLVQLSQLRASGALSQGEFATANARILAT